MAMVVWTDFAQRAGDARLELGDEVADLGRVSGGLPGERRLRRGDGQVRPGHPPAQPGPPGVGSTGAAARSARRTPAWKSSTRARTADGSARVASTGRTTGAARG
ncbi:hypothetical protein, partial [Micromonospora sp. ATA51]|uniref:hypothetical protein n=1 Tax=Micromonospora sp. ATA51 TaxID=2806098 RepID=UPI001A5FF3E0